MARLGMVGVMLVVVGCGTYTGAKLGPCVKVVGSHLCRPAAPRSTVGGALHEGEEKAELPAPKAKR